MKLQWVVFEGVQSAIADWLQARSDEGYELVTHQVVVRKIWQEGGELHMGEQTQHCVIMRRIVQMQQVVAQ